MKLKDVCIKGTSNIRQKDVNDSGRYPVYGAAGPVGFMNSFQYDEPYVGVVKDGAGIGRATYLPSNSSIIGTMQALIPKKNVLPKYLYYAVSSMHLEKYYSGATIPHIYFKNYKHERFVLVSKKEQEQIIWRFSLLEKMISNKQQQLLKLDELIKARFVEMFGDPIINNKNIKKKKLGDICLLKAGDFTPSKKISPVKTSINKYPCFGGNGIRGYVDNYTHQGNYSLIGRQGALCGNVKFATGKFRNTEHAILVSPNIEINSRWLFELLNLEKLNRFRSGAAQPGLAVKTLNEIIVPVADLNSQNEYANFVQQVDKSKFENIVYLNKTLLNKILSQIGDVIRD
ncbi:restriction endonuclease subunit S [Limosilactobacillus reuteri]|uniref:restriction endonuclease subunit S n=1 Tax=Limosilactobacillus reuteri TaxID=1598 RepID=UPI00006B80CF|nr:restriction endonuclease subunit S [Limosilactobacillus reuteri]MCC4461007.1 restriction endonuclease subunit S [Limosilactobacillus reuteri]MCC4462542.1 restriction endonuclease subunit S [Limosilactobacillus reuteri]MCC4511754.1 restriction endonuclease subunit S [Limosilactobacillus reuteri]MCC4513412.1 restriction endonuclease subunit S [Limosilactobacillus reuteri]MCT3210757.1 restriction endonuclease subunit S [Limosilactobacillus reuteri]